MEVDFSFLCDYADNSSGKLAAFGIGIDTIYAPTLPVRHPLMYAVIALRFSLVEVGQKRIGLHLIDADGNPQIPQLDTTIRVEPPPPGYTHRVQRIALALYGVGFARYGDYSIRWLVDGHEVKTLPVKILAPPRTGTTPQG